MTSFILNGTKINVHQLAHDELDMGRYSDFEYNTLNIIKDWLLGRKEFSIKTSGSTGKPNTVTFAREQLTLSARRTLKAFNLKAGDKVLACLHPHFVAGLMMLIRSLEGNLSLTVQSPDSISLAGFLSDQPMNFASFTPNQIEKLLKVSPEKLSLFNKILIGGAGLHPEVEKKLKRINSEIYHSYAMTETLTHTALRKIGAHENSMLFHAMEGVTYDVDQRSCLIIHDELLGIKGLPTNDIVELVNNKSFIWKGRYDNAINSGGIKIQLEETEQMIETICREMNTENKICLIPQPDPALTHKLVMLMEEKPLQPDSDALLRKIKEKLPKYYAPKILILVPQIFRTASGKIDRQKNLEKYTN